MKGLVDKDTDGWVEIATIASFARMKTLSTDNDEIVAALKTSPSLLKVSEDGTKVKRTIPLPEKIDVNELCSYAKGFKEDTTLDEVEAFFNALLQEGEKLACVRMRRMKDRKFKGSVFLEFSTKAAAERIAGLTVKFTGQEEPLLMMTKEKYMAMKKEENANKSNKKRKTEDDLDDSKGKEEEVDETFTEGLIVHVSGLTEEASRETIKECFEGAGAKVAFVEYSRGQPAGYIRLNEATEVSGAELVKKLTDADTEINGAKVTFKLLEGEEEKSYYAKVREQKGSRKGKGGGKGGKGKGGKGRKRARN